MCFITVYAGEQNVNWKHNTHTHTQRHKMIFFMSLRTIMIYVFMHYNDLCVYVL